MKPSDLVNPGFKKCFNEKIEKPIEEFSMLENGHYHPDCKTCRNLKSKNKRKLDKIKNQYKQKK